MSPGSGEDHIQRDTILLNVEDNTLTLYFWNSKENQYQEAVFWIKDSASITLTSEEYGTTQLSAALATNQFESDITRSNDTLRIRMSAIDLISSFLVLAHIKYIDYYYIKTSKTVNVN